MRDVGSISTFNDEKYELLEDHIVPEEKKKKFMVWLNIVTLLVTAVLVAIHWAFTHPVIPGGESMFSGANDLLMYWVIFMVVFLVYIIVHELLHGLVFVLSTKKGFRTLKFGFVAKSGMAYCCSKIPVKVKGGRLSLMMPVYAVCIPMYILSLVINSPWLGILAILLFSGSAGDIYYMWKLRKTNKELYMYEVLPSKSGYEVGYLLFKKLN